MGLHFKKTLLVMLDRAMRRAQELSQAMGEQQAKLLVLTSILKNFVIIIQSVFLSSYDMILGCSPSSSTPTGLVLLLSAQWN